MDLDNTSLPYFIRYASFMLEGGSDSSCYIEDGSGRLKVKVIKKELRCAT